MLEYALDIRYSVNKSKSQTNVEVSQFLYILYFWSKLTAHKYLSENAPFFLVAAPKIWVLLNGEEKTKH